MAQRRFTVEDDMGGVTPVMPAGKKRIISLETGHDRQQAPWPDETGKTVELLRWPVKMFNGLATGHEILGAAQGSRRRLEERIIQRHFMTGFAQHFCQGGTGAAAEIQT